MFSVAYRELRNALLAPATWILLAAVQALQGLLFYRLVRAYQARPVTSGDQAGVSYQIGALALGSASYVMLLVVPLLTMLAICGERRQHTLILLRSAPIATSTWVLGKYLALLAVLGILLLLLAAMPALLIPSTTLDFGLLAAALLGLGLLLASFAAVGLYLSALARQPALAALGAVAALLPLWLAESFATSGWPWLDGLLRYLSMYRHFEPLLNGTVASVDVAYFILFSALFIGLTVLRLRNEVRG